jgi:toxin YoeB
MRHLTFTDEAWANYSYWQPQDRRTPKRINDLIEAIKRDPFSGIGTP